MLLFSMIKPADGKGGLCRFTALGTAAMSSHKGQIVHAIACPIPAEEEIMPGSA